MRFYLITLSIYSVAVTILAGLLMMQNRELKTRGGGGAPPPVNYEEVHQIDLQDVPTIGAEEAPITVVAFSDFECQFCAKGSANARKLLDKFPGQVKLAFKNLPLSFHDHARGAASAALAAYRQGKFWEMEAKLFANQDRLGEDLYHQLAGELGLDTEAFSQQMEINVWEEYIKQHEDEARGLKVSGTPTFFVNGVMIRGASYDSLVEAVEHFLEKAS